MNYYSVTIEVIKNSQHDSFETHYAVGENGSTQGAISSVKNTLRKIFNEKYPNDIFEFVVAPDGVVQISKQMYDDKK